MSFNSHRCDTTSEDIYVARVGANGEVIDTNGFSVCMATGLQRRPKVSCGKDNFLVLWEDDRNFDSTGYDIYGARITSSGMVLDPDGKRITSFSYQEKAPYLTWGKENFLAIWEAGDFSGNWDISGEFIDTSGTSSDSSSFVISTACDAQLFGKSWWNGSSFLSVWEEDHDLYGKRIDHLGNLLDSASIPISLASEDQKHPSLAWGGESFLAVWEDFRNLNFDIYGARIDSGGNVLDVSALPFFSC